MCSPENRQRRLHVQLHILQECNQIDVPNSNNMLMSLNRKKQTHGCERNVGEYCILAIVIHAKFSVADRAVHRSPGSVGCLRQGAASLRS